MPPPSFLLPRPSDRKARPYIVVGWHLVAGEADSLTSIRKKCQTNFPPCPRSSWTGTQSSMSGTSTTFTRRFVATLDRCARLRVRPLACACPARVAIQFPDRAAAGPARTSPRILSATAVPCPQRPHVWRPELTLSAHVRIGRAPVKISVLILWLVPAEPLPPVTTHSHSHSRRFLLRCWLARALRCSSHSSESSSRPYQACSLLRFSSPPLLPAITSSSRRWLALAPWPARSSLVRPRRLGV